MRLLEASGLSLHQKLGIAREAGADALVCKCCGVRRTRPKHQVTFAHVYIAC